MRSGVRATMTDEQLVATTVAGDESAFDVLLARYQERLLRFLSSRAANHADAEDALQTAFLDAYRYLHTFDPRWRFSTWLYRIALRSLPKPGIGVLRDDAAELADPTADPVADVERQAERENLWTTARRLLSERAYVALWLRYVEDMSTTDVAAAMQESESWVKVTVMRARQKLSPFVTRGDG